MVGRGGGVTELEAYRVAGRIVVLLHIDVRDAMGANVVNAVCEAAWDALDVPAGRAGLRILTNHSPSLRRASARCRVPFAAVGGEAVARAIVEAWEFSQVDVFRAVTHNKGLMNGIDAVLVATGNDWRAVEAGVHAFAARAPPYRGLGHYALDDGALVAALELPLAVGTVGGVTRLHPVAAACLRVLGAEHGPDLARILAAVGLAQNLAALRALAAEGIQAGHMRLHAANRRLWEQTDEGGRADVGRPTADGAQRADGLQPADREPAGAKRADVRRRKPKSR
jgi:hydroxymethylglutaryl-CoA reductase